ncbi:MAG TPA: FHA domain-containing protein, partial [Polyangia bacterium]
CGTRLDANSGSTATVGAATPSSTSSSSSSSSSSSARAAAPSTASAVQGRLVLIRPDGTEGGVHPLVDGENVIGRGLGPLFDADGYLSPRHAEIVLNAAGGVVRDTGSLNGVYVKLSDEEELVDGDIFRIGQELLRFDAIAPPVPLEDGTDVMGSPNPGYWGRLALIVGRDQDGSAFPLFGDSVTLGRERGDILFPEDGYVSGQHARVTMRDGRFYLEDLNSSNGTFVRVRGERAIKPGAAILMGQQLFRISY